MIREIKGSGQYPITTPAPPIHGKGNDRGEPAGQNPGDIGPSSTDKATGKIAPTLIAFLAAAAFMVLCESLNEFVFPDLQLWGLHVGSVILCAVSAGMAVGWMLRRQLVLLRRTEDEITERKRVEKALREKEELYHAVVESVADGIAITAGTERIFVNRSFLDIHGIQDPSEVLGHDFDRFIVGEDREAVREAILSRQEEEADDTMTEYRIVRPDGTMRNVQASIAPIPLKEGNAALAVLRDITQIKEAQTEIVRLNEKLEQHVRDLEIANHDLEAFNSTVSHDLRTPLIAIDGFSRRMAEKYGHSFDEKCSDLLKRIRDNVKRMNQLIEDLLSYSRLGRQALQHEPISMGRLFGEVVDELRGVYPEGDVTVSEMPEALGDPRMIRQVVTNLLANAFKFSRKKEKRIIQINGWKEDGESIYSVKDNGVGFDMAHRDKLFQIFSRLHGQDEFDGTGIGLAIVKRIVTLNGGRVWAEGAPGEGATFCFTLPDK